jgi:competence ComEA-like helix-hairpin-helix protein
MTMNASNRRNRISLGARRPGSAPLGTCVALAALLAVTITASAQQPAGAPAPENGAAAPAADAKGAATFARVCSTCHDGARILSNRRSRSQWTEVIEKMMERGAQVSDDDFTEVMDYLLRHYGRINVNKAEAEDLAVVAGLSKKDAEAIVRYRDAQGDFPDFDALAKVPEIDIEKLNQAREAITF